jgi:hypothetical protein
MITTTYKAKVHDPARRGGVCNVKSILVFEHLWDATAYATVTANADHLLSIEIIQEARVESKSVLAKRPLGFWRWDSSVNAVRSFPR